MGKRTDDHWNDPVTNLRREASIPVEQVTPEKVLGGTLPERRDSCERIPYVRKGKATATGVSRTVLNDSFLWGCTFLTTPPEVLEKQEGCIERQFLSGGYISTDVHKLCLWKKCYC